MLYPDNGSVIDNMKDELLDMTLDRIEGLLSTDLEALENMSRLERVQRELVDPVRCFVKAEPHKQNKLAEGRVRLIASVSLVDKLIEMLLHRPLHKKEIANWRTIPSKPGIGFTPEMNQYVYEDVKSHKDAVDTDIQGWDWSVKSYMTKDCAEAEILLCENPSPCWKHLVRCEAIKEVETVYMFSDGTFVAPNYSGIVNSGKYKTSRGNSWKRVYLSKLVGAEWCIAAGDDSVEGYVENAVEKYKAMGFRIKNYDRVGNTFEFCSRLYANGYSYPVNGDKALMNLLHSQIKDVEQFEMQMLQFTDGMEHHPEFPAYIQLLSDIGFLSCMGLRGPQDASKETEQEQTPDGYE